MSCLSLLCVLCACARMRACVCVRALVAAAQRHAVAVVVVVGVVGVVLPSLSLALLFVSVEPSAASRPQSPPPRAFANRSSGGGSLFAHASHLLKPIFPHTKTRNHQKRHPRRCTHPLHSGHGRMLRDHLISSYVLLKQWGLPKHVCAAGMFHAVYGEHAAAATTLFGVSCFGVVEWSVVALAWGGCAWLEGVRMREGRRAAVARPRAVLGVSSGFRRRRR